MSENINYYLAIDIGASSGRHILGFIENGKLFIEEIYRFENRIIEKNNHLFWDVDQLFDEVKVGMKIAARFNKIPVSVGIDTWGVDYVLLDENHMRLKDVSCYRDNRTKSFQDLKISRNDIYTLTGIQHQPFNTLFQLNSEQNKIKDNSKHFLMVPDYLHFLLSGVMINEYTNMSTTQLLDVNTRTIDDSLLSEIKIKSSIFNTMVQPSTLIGELTKDIQEEVGYRCKIITPATHDTGSSYMASLVEDEIILSSGTWSLLGVELETPVLNELAYQNNFTNEGGFNNKIRFLKNIMGLWLIQEVARELRDQYTFSQLVIEARTSNFELVFDVNDERFLSPKSMIKEIEDYFAERNLSLPQTVGDIAYCIFHSLAVSYRENIKVLEEITHKTYSKINVLGGGCKNELLNELIEKECQKEIVVGPIESTAIGNLIAQMIGNREIRNMKEAKDIIKHSFEIKRIEREGHEHKTTL